MLYQHEYVETQLATKFSKFKIRVYPDEVGKETLVLWTDNLDNTEPVLVRVHSECLTGDVLGSLQCDCGKQLNKSLQLIAEEGGVLIYLRQEGRGIGLFEKIKSYQLQSTGIDTFEANVRLGHQPDARSYEMVRTILEDLKIARIKLLTNNPSKVSDIAKLGIEIVERVPLISKPNVHNRKYLETKRKKFQHFSKSTAQYFYQFQVDLPEQVEEIISFLKDKRKDPFLNFCVAISANCKTLKSPSEINKVNSLFQVCNHTNDVIPVLHFSFLNSMNVIEDAETIKKIWPFVKRVQLNDLMSLTVPILKKLSTLFTIDIPLSDENFEIIHNNQFRELIKKNEFMIILDNSKGRGIKEPKELYIQKIDALLSYDLNNISLSGGFGPDELDRYFEIRRYYRFNFSIDAETRLKTDGKIDVQKIKQYLTQLIRFNDPKQEGIEQTKRFLEKHRRSTWDQVEIHKTQFLIHPKVFHAGFFPSSAWFAQELAGLLKNNTNFCEIGCGSGVISCLIALANPNMKITSTDINPFASENTKINADRLGLGSRISVFTGDVLDSIPKDALFDSIFWALPFGFLDPRTDVSLEEVQVFDPGYRAIRKFFQKAKQHLKPQGRLLIGFSSDLGHQELLEEIARDSGVKLSILRKTLIKEDKLITFELLEGLYV